MYRHQTYVILFSGSSSTRRTLRGFPDHVMRRVVSIDVLVVCDRLGFSAYAETNEVIGEVEIRFI